MAKEKKIKKKKVKTFKDSFKHFLIFIIIIAIAIAAFMGYLIYQESYKYRTYKTKAADLVDSSKTYVNGVSYYYGNYTYTVNKKQYYYTSNELVRGNPDEVITIKYNKKNPSDVYDEKARDKYLIILIVSLCVALFLMLIVVAITPSNLNEVIVAEVVEFANCVGGRRVYLCDLSIPNTSPDYYDKKYYAYFTSDYDKFKVGNRLSFNKFKYGEAFTTEAYRTVRARSIYNFKDDDFTVVEPEKKSF